MKPSSSLLTVASISHTPQALATLRSARFQGKHVSFNLFAVDATEECVEQLRQALGEDAGWIRVFGPTDLGAERARFLAAFDQYNLMEVCCLAKYVGLVHVLRTDPIAGVCIYLDADTFATGDLNESIQELGNSAVLLTPHLMEPSSDANEHDIMIHGWMNAGFVAFRREHPRTFAVLDWLIDRITRRGYFAPQYGLSCDQKWVSSLPVLFADVTRVSTHRGVNVGYWNLNERPLTRSGSGILAGGNNLLLVHFSGFDWTRSGRFSRNAETTVTPGSVLEELCERYSLALNESMTLYGRVQSLETFECNSGSLTDRMNVGAVRFATNLAAPAARLGPFSRLGGKIDSLIRKTTIRF